MEISIHVPREFLNRSSVSSVSFAEIVIKIKGLFFWKTVYARQKNKPVTVYDLHYHITVDPAVRRLIHVTSDIAYVVESCRL